jgi:aspartate 1-decarboxylase
MYIQVLKSKLKQVIVTESTKSYEGSLILCPYLISAANLYPYERVEINGVNRKERHVTYIVPGKKGDVIIAGGLAQYFKKRDKIHVNCFALVTRDVTPRPRAVYTDENNKIVKTVSL